MRKNRIGTRKYEPHLLQDKVITDARRARNTSATRKHAREPENPRRDERDREEHGCAKNGDRKVWPADATRRRERINCLLGSHAHSSNLAASACKFGKSGREMILVVVVHTR